MINIDNIIKEFVEKKWSGKVVQVPRIWLTSIGSGLFYEVVGEITKYSEHTASIYHKPSSEHSSEEPEHTASEGKVCGKTPAKEIACYRTGLI